MDPNQYKKHFYIRKLCGFAKWNPSDSEIVASSSTSNGFGATRNVEEADFIFAEIALAASGKKPNKPLGKRLTEFRNLKQEQNPALWWACSAVVASTPQKQTAGRRKLDMVGPDAYRTLPAFLVEEAETGQKAVNVMLSRDEIHAGYFTRTPRQQWPAFVSIMRVGNNIRFAWCPYLVAVNAAARYQHSR